MDEKKRFFMEVSENDILENKIRILEVKPLSELKREHRVIPKNMCKVNKEIRPGIRIVEEGEIDRVETEYVDA